jgi:hypothetical protein
MTANAPEPLFGPPAPQAKRDRAARITSRAHPEVFPTPEAAKRFLKLIIVPPSLAWSFVSVGKSASTSTLSALFQAEFGHPLSVAFNSAVDINPDAVVHQLAEARVFARWFHLGRPVRALTGPDGPTERFCVVRDPFARAVSAFRYLCMSQRAGASWFLPMRLRLNAQYGFDWEQDMDTHRGFELFLTALLHNSKGPEPLDPHWRPQVEVICPTVYEPTLIGRIEAYDAFLAEMSERLSVSIQHPRHRNAQSTTAAQQQYDTPALRTLVERVYQADFEAFGY